MNTGVPLLIKQFLLEAPLLADTLEFSASRTRIKIVKGVLTFVPELGFGVGSDSRHGSYQFHVNSVLLSVHRVVEECL